MHCSHQGNTARASAAEDVVHATTDGTHESSPPKLSVVHDSVDSVRLVADAASVRTDAERSNRFFGWCVAVGLVVLVALLAVVMFNAGRNVEVLP